MEFSSTAGFSELGLVDPSLLHQWHLMNSVDELSILPLAAAFGENLQQVFAQQTRDLTTSMGASATSPAIRPAKQLKTNSWSPCKTDHSTHIAASPNNLSFVNSNQVGIAKPKEEAVCNSKSIHTLPSSDHVMFSQGSFANQNSEYNKAYQGVKRASTGARLSQAQDHIIAERKRREKLSQRFIALSAIVPGLKKMDKASVLGDAIKYLKQLQERVNTLEEQTRKKTMESVVFVKKSQLFADGDNSSSDENTSSDLLHEKLPEIEARFCDRSVLIRIHCEKKKGVFEKIVAEIEKLHLSVVSSNVMTFGNSSLDVTIIAQMDAEFSMSVKDLVKNLLSSFESFM